jgi:hypothetical protein
MVQHACDLIAPVFGFLRPSISGVRKTVNSASMSLAAAVLGACIPCRGVQASDIG